MIIFRSHVNTHQEGVAYQCSRLRSVQARRQMTALLHPETEKGKKSSAPRAAQLRPISGPDITLLSCAFPAPRRRYATLISNVEPMEAIATGEAFYVK
jgi:hypothetical protein